MQAGVLSDSQALVEALEKYGLTVGPVDGAEVLVLEVDRMTPQAMVTMRRRAYVVALMGWWDEREQEYREAADFVLNTPIRGWQVQEMIEDF